MAQVNHWTEQEKATAERIILKILQDNKDINAKSIASLVMGQLKHLHGYAPKGAHADWDRAESKTNSSQSYHDLVVSLTACVTSCMNQSMTAVATAEKIVTVLIQDGLFPPK